MSFRSRFQQFFYGRYGADQLYNALFLWQLILLFSGALFSFLGNFHAAFSVIAIVLYALGISLFVWTLFRCLSRNHGARRRENQAYLRLKARLRHPFRKSRASRPADTSTHVFRTCPRCNAHLRLPREPGKHTVKCPRCTHRFKVKVKK